MTTRQPHKAIRYGNEWQCHLCGKAWHIKDDNPPQCVTRSEYASKKIELIRKDLGLA